MAGKAAKTVRVSATRNLDMMNAGEVTELERDDRVEALLKSGHLVEVDEQGVAKDGSTPAATVDPGAAAPEQGSEGTSPASAPARGSRSSR